MYAACSKAGNAYAPPNDILKIDLSIFTPDFLSDCYRRVFKHYSRLAEKHKTNGEHDYDGLAKGQGQYLLKAVNGELRRRFNQRKKESAKVS